MTREQHRRAYMARCAETIARHGWMVQAVFPDDVGDTEPGFAYTAGLSAFDHPELIIYALPHDTAGTLLNQLGERVREGETLLPGRLEGLLQDLPVWLVPVVDPHELTVARSLYGEVSALQVVWPDPEGRPPWDGGYEQTTFPQPFAGGARWASFQLSEKESPL